MKLTARSLVTFAALGAVTPGCAAVVVGSSLFGGRRVADAAARFFARVVKTAVGMELTAVGMERVPPGAYVVVSNHQSHLDSVALFLSSPTPLRMLAKKSLFRIPFFGQGMAAMGHVPIDRRKGKTDFESLRRHCEELRRHGESVMIFAEGTRSEDGRVHPFKSGAFHIARELGLPIVPVSITGTGGVLPAQSLRVTPGRARIEWHAPVDVAGLGIEEAAERVRAVIREAVDGA